jgi:nitroreductase
MDFSELIRIRQSDRKYSSKTVEKEKIIQCIEAARLSPSACNSQPWRFIIVDDQELKDQIADSSASLGMNKFTFESPVIIAVVLEKMKLTASVGSVLKDKEYSLIDIGISVNQFCLQAAELGLGTCIIGWFNESRVKELLQVPKSKRVPLIISLGYSEARTRDKTRKPLEEIYSWNKY